VLNQTAQNQKASNQTSPIQTALNQTLPIQPQPLTSLQIPNLQALIQFQLRVNPLNQLTLPHGKHR
jgi:hypothetical protein